MADSARPDRYSWRPRSKAQLGARLARCPRCGRTVWSQQPSVVLSADPLVIAHAAC